MAPCRRAFRSINITVGFALLALASCKNNEIVVVEQAVVVEVVDGDTVRLRVPEATFVVRLIGVDAPETKHPTKGVQCFGPEASSFLTRALPPGTTVRLERDIEARDVYDRLLLYLFVPTEQGERFINLELVARGLAMPLSIEPNTRYQESFVRAAFSAQREARGLWRACK
jgi:micrococcal nuclease